MSVATIYDTIGESYAIGRRTDPLIAAQIHRFLAGADSILNVGAGSGSYEPVHPRLIAVEPSETMIQQRDASPHPVVKAFAESLPFDDKTFSHCMSVLSMHHWLERTQAFHEISRVTRDKLIVVTWDPDADPFWLTRAYFPEIYQIDKEIFPPLSEFARAFEDLEVVELPIPANCIDGFTGAYWRRPDAYLLPDIRARMSTFSKLTNVEKGLERLRSDLRSGAWVRRYGDILEEEQLDIGYRIIVAQIGPQTDA